MRILILSDIHANLVALETVMASAEGKYDAIWCLGDIVGYGPRPNECVELLRDEVSICVIGNHLFQALNRSGVDVDDFNPAAKHAILWTQDQLNSRTCSYLDSLTDVPVCPTGHSRLCSPMPAHASRLGIHSNAVCRFGRILRASNKSYALSDTPTNR